MKCHQILECIWLVVVQGPTSTNLLNERTNKKLVVWQTDMVGGLALAEVQDPASTNLINFCSRQTKFIGLVIAGLDNV